LDKIWKLAMQKYEQRNIKIGEEEDGRHKQLTFDKP